MTYTSGIAAVVALTVLFLSSTPLPEHDQAEGTALVAAIGYLPGTETAVDDLVLQAEGIITIRIPEIHALIAIVPSSALDILVGNHAVRYVDVHNSIDGVALSTSSIDPLLAEQWGLPSISIPDAWKVRGGDPRLLLAVVDFGINATHEDLGHVWTDPTTGAKGRNFVTFGEPNDIEDAYGHGVHVGGIVGAKRHNGVGIAGITNSTTMNLRAGVASTDLIALSRAIIFATDAGAKVVSVSLGSTNYHALVQDAVTYAASRGVLVVAAAGNTGTPPVHFPASAPEVVAVGAVNHELNRAVDSSYGPELELMAPGVQVLSLHNPILAVMEGCSGKAYCFVSGTSQATPMVAGVSSLVLSCHPMLLGQQVRDLLARTAGDIGELGRDELTGYGLVNASASVRSARDANGGKCGATDLRVHTSVSAGSLFNDGASGWSMGGLWHRNGSRDAGSGGSWSYSNAQGNYNVGPTSGTLMSPAISLLGSLEPRLSFARWESTEADPSMDRREVDITWNGGITWQNIYKSAGVAQRTWVQEEVAIPGDALGKLVQFRFTFQADDALANDYGGWVVDEVTVYEAGSGGAAMPAPTSGTISLGECHTHTIVLDNTVVRSFHVRLDVPEGLDLDLSLEAPGGNVTGGSSCNSAYMATEIPSSSYSGFEADPEWVHVWPIPASGTYKIHVNAYAGPSSGSGSYLLYLDAA